MNCFYRDRSVLTCDGVPLGPIGDAVGTPLYVYSAAEILRRYREIDRCFGPYPHSVHYALKANSVLAIVRLLQAAGSKVDANSGGEIEVALRAGFVASEIVFTGVGKTPGEIERAVALGIGAINAESAGELERIDASARARGIRTRVALRVNPDIDARSHPHISTGLKTNKFGVPLGWAMAVCREAAGRSGLDLVGIHIHIGSQIVDMDPIRRAATVAVGLARQLVGDGIHIEHVDLGGGLGISYDGSRAPAAAEYVETLLDVVGDSGLRIVIEPGRWIVGPSGVLLVRVVDVKEQPGGGYFVVTDGGMTELIRPALYGAYHRIEAVSPSSGSDVSCDIVGPLCESSDTLGEDRMMPLPRVGDVLAVMDAGAYGSAMASTYNRRTLPAEVLVDGGGWRVVRRRQTLDDMLVGEE